MPRDVENFAQTVGIGGPNSPVNLFGLLAKTGQNCDIDYLEAKWIHGIVEQEMTVNERTERQA